ncbi:glycosyltransferase family 4 protein [Thermochromatium tepidum]|uniref:Glycosyltransferase n=1 Tax=Thermochromatium tepidum ATCC 43061 TaxID=316276 RepID=A0A6I6E682_THETI|nr:glycosyltransferase family 1 protein [Thermochromatium tepidum]QGU33352.1 glycosyltransferase [Thermochromatium tepidum ATCC 43061]
MPRETWTTPPSKGDRLRIAIVTETYPPEINGVANTMRHLAEGMASRGHKIQLIRPRQPADPRHPAPSNTLDLLLVPGLPIPGYRGLRFGLPVYWRLRRLWYRRPVDLVYIATQGPLGHAALSAALALKIPTITGFHTHFEQYSRHYGLGALTRQIAKTLRHFHNRSDATLVPTVELRDSLAAEGFENLHVFGRGVDVDQFAPERRSAELRRSWGCTEDDLVVLYVGRIAAEKNLALALAGFNAIQRQCPSARFVLVGDGPERPHLQQEHPDLIFAGARVGDDLAAHYASGDLFLFPSLTETFGNVVTEAMASGLPIIAFDYAAAHAHIQPWINGVTVPVDDQESFIDSCLECVSDRERLRRMGLEARKCALDIGWERVLGRVEEHLFDVIHRKRGQTESCHASLATTSE